MRCFEVELNGERYCLAGVGDVGALSAFVTYVGVRGSEGEPVIGPTYLSVSGLRLGGRPAARPLAGGYPSAGPW
jgi:hypothetical protein